MCTLHGARATQAGRNVTALSISIGGPLRIAEGVLRNPLHLTGWHQVRLKDRLLERFPSLPMRITQRERVPRTFPTNLQPL